MLCTGLYLWPGWPGVQRASLTQHDGTSWHRQTRKLYPALQGAVLHSWEVTFCCSPLFIYLFDIHQIGGGRDGLLVDSRPRDQKVVSLNPGRRMYFSRVNFVHWLLFSVHSTPVLWQWHIKDLSYSAKSAGGRLHLNTHTPVTQQSWSGMTMPLSRYGMGTYQGIKLTYNSSGNAQSQSSQFTEPLCTDPGLGEGICLHVLISTSRKKKKKHRWGMNGQTVSQNPHKWGK